MPSVCIHVRKTYSESEEIAIMNAVQVALVTAFDVGPEDKNITLIAHRPHRFSHRQPRERGGDVGSSHRQTVSRAARIAPQLRAAPAAPSKPVIGTGAR